MSESISAFQAFPQLLGTWLTEHAQAVWWYTALVRFLFPILALLVLVRAIRGLLRVPHTPEQWGQLSLPGGGSLPIDHWENILGRSSSADIRLIFHRLPPARRPSPGRVRFLVGHGPGL